MRSGHRLIETQDLEDMVWATNKDKKICSLSKMLRGKTFILTVTTCDELTVCEPFDTRGCTRGINLASVQPNEVECQPALDNPADITGHITHDVISSFQRLHEEQTAAVRCVYLRVPILQCHGRGTSIANALYCILQKIRSVQ